MAGLLQQALVAYEEGDHVGVEHYVDGLSDVERARLVGIVAGEEMPVDVERARLLRMLLAFRATRHAALLAVVRQIQRDELTGMEAARCVSEMRAAVSR